MSRARWRTTFTPKMLSPPYAIPSSWQRCPVIGSSITSGEPGARSSEAVLFGGDVLTRPSGFCRDLLRWLNSAVRKSTGSEETARERDEHIRLVEDGARIVC